MRRTVPPSAELEARIEQMLSVGVGENPRETLSELAKLGARLIIQRAVEDEFDAWLGRARYERRAPDQREERVEESGMRNGFRSRRLQAAEGELAIEIPQVRQAAETFASKLFPRTPDQQHQAAVKATARLPLPAGSSTPPGRLWSATSSHPGAEPSRPPRRCACSARDGG